MSTFRNLHFLVGSNIAAQLKSAKYEVRTIKASKTLDQKHGIALQELTDANKLRHTDGKATDIAERFTIQLVDDSTPVVTTEKYYISFQPAPRPFDSLVLNLGDPISSEPIEISLGQMYTIPATGEPGLTEVPWLDKKAFGFKNEMAGTILLYKSTTTPDDNATPIRELPIFVPGIGKLTPHIPPGPREGTSGPLDARVWFEIEGQGEPDFVQQTDFYDVNYAAGEADQYVEFDEKGRFSKATKDKFEKKTVPGVITNGDPKPHTPHDPTKPPAGTGGTGGTKGDDTDSDSDNDP